MCRVISELHNLYDILRLTRCSDCVNEILGSLLVSKLDDYFCSSCLFININLFNDEVSFDVFSDDFLDFLLLQVLLHKHNLNVLEDFSGSDEDEGDEGFSAGIVTGLGDHPLKVYPSFVGSSG